MKLLIVEDDEFKLSQLIRFFETELQDWEILFQKSFTSAVRALKTVSFDLLILDMTLPVYDINAKEQGYETLFFAGRDVLEELARKKISCPVIVVTQFEQFGEGDETMTLEELSRQLSERFHGLYNATVYYHPSQEDWKVDLQRAMKQIGVFGS